MTAFTGRTCLLLLYPVCLASTESVGCRVCSRSCFTRYWYCTVSHHCSTTFMALTECWCVNFSPHRFQTPNRPAGRESLYRLHHPGDMFSDHPRCPSDFAGGVGRRQFTPRERKQTSDMILAEIFITYLKIGSTVYTLRAKTHCSI